MMETHVHYRITGLPAAPFVHLYDLSDQALARHGAMRCRVDAPAAYPDRIELRDAEVGESVILVNHLHQPADNAFRSSHAIFVLEGAVNSYDGVDQVPAVMRRRTLSLRAFDRDDFMVDADLCEGTEAERLIARLLTEPRVAYLHAHYARRGCYAARVERA